MTTLKNSLLSYAFASSEASTLLLKFEGHPEGLQHCSMQQSLASGTLWQTTVGGPCLQYLPKHPCPHPSWSLGACTHPKAAFQRELLLNWSSLEVLVGTWAPLEGPISISSRFVVFLLLWWLQLDVSFFLWVCLRHQQHPFEMSFKNCVMKSHCLDACMLWHFHGALEHLKLGQFRNTNIPTGLTAYVFNVSWQRPRELCLGKLLLCKLLCLYYSDVSVELQALFSCVVVETVMVPQHPLSCRKSN